MLTINNQSKNQPLTDEIYSLLTLADPNIEAIRSYIKDATILVATDEQVRVAVAAITFTQQHNQTVAELKNIAVAEQHQGKGIAKRLIAAVKQQAISQGAKQLIVGTGNSSLSQLGLYQKCGFRISHIIKDFFINYPEPIIENGIQCIDMVMLTCELGDK